MLYFKVGILSILSSKGNDINNTNNIHKHNCKIDVNKIVNILHIISSIVKFYSNRICLMSFKDFINN